MKKATTFIMLILSITIIFTACENNLQKTNVKKNDEKETITLKKDIPDGTFTEKGKGTFHITTPSGTSENGNIPVLMVKQENLAGEEMQDCIDLGIYAWDFDGTKSSKIYVDGVCQETEQLSNSQTSIFVAPELTTIGKHKVEVLQFDDNNNVITYKSAQYEIKILK